MKAANELSEDRRCIRLHRLLVRVMEARGTALRLGEKEIANGMQATIERIDARLESFPLYRRAVGRKA